MSAWFIYSALGFYPVNPVSGEYIVGRCVLIEYYLQVTWMVANIVPLCIAHFLMQLPLTCHLQTSHCRSLHLVQVLSYMLSH